MDRKLTFKLSDDIVTYDDKELSTLRDVSQTIKNFLFDVGDVDVISLPDYDSKTMNMILKFVYNEKNFFVKEYGEMADALKLVELVKLVKLANYLDVKEDMIDDICKEIANILKGKKAEEMAVVLGL